MSMWTRGEGVKKSRNFVDAFMDIPFLQGRADFVIKQVFSTKTLPPSEQHKSLGIFFLRPLPLSPLLPLVPSGPYLLPTSERHKKNLPREISLLPSLF